MSESDSTSDKNVKLISEMKSIIEKLNMAKQLKDTKLIKVLNKELKKKKAENKKLQQELFMEGLLKT